ncbi:DUF1127 domain-containing protein [uncultured Nitratireductor sp.]|uniref:DUF1127 domain-containing protein n=1 Tax=uncultured Nitratireductor sp. TaxID=520953 RepID=UPI0025F58C3A|nr:DUF1127 domain-containing protein [uncultured Nitratireductor sp.]
MTCVQTNTVASTAVAQPAGMVRAVAVSFVLKVTRFWKTRDAMRQLSEMSDWQLADIGLTRSDLDSVALNAPRILATRALQEIAYERTRMAAIHGSVNRKL